MHPEPTPGAEYFGTKTARWSGRRRGGEPDERILDQVPRQTVRVPHVECDERVHRRLRAEHLRTFQTGGRLPPLPATWIINRSRSKSRPRSVPIIAKILLSVFRPSASPPGTLRFSGGAPQISRCVGIQHRSLVAALAHYAKAAAPNDRSGAAAHCRMHASARMGIRKPPGWAV